MKYIALVRPAMYAVGALFVVFTVMTLFTITSRYAVSNIGSNISTELQLRGPEGKNGVLAATLLPGGVVKYAYRSDEAITAEPSEKIIEAAERENLRVADEILDRRTPYARTFGTVNSNLVVTEIIGGDPQYYEDAQGNWSQIEYATTSEYAFNQQMNVSPLFADLLWGTAFAQSTFLSEASSSITVDGVLYQSASCQTWSSLRGLATSTSVNDTAESEALHIRACNSSGDWDRLHRHVAGFDTSSIPDSDAIISATQSWYIGGITDSTALNQALGITTYSPISNDALSINDYDSFGSIRLANDIDIGSLTANAYNDWIYNTNGLSAVNKTGITNTMLRFSSDIDNSSPTWTSGEESLVFALFADTPGTSEDPKLVVTHADVTPLSERKNSNESVTSSTSLQDDNDLLLTLEGSNTYAIEGVILASSTSATPDIVIGFTGPVGSNIKVGYTTADDNGVLQASGVGSARIALPANSATAIMLKGTVTTSSAGDLQLRWAQATSNGNATIVGAGSYLQALEI